MRRRSEGFSFVDGEVKSSASISDGSSGSGSSARYRPAADLKSPRDSVRWSRQSWPGGSIGSSASNFGFTTSRFQSPTRTERKSVGVNVSK